MIVEKVQRKAKIARLLVIPVLLALLFGCGDDALAPVEEPPPDLTTPEGVLNALAKYYIRRLDGDAENVLALLGNTYTFVPALPESIPFLAQGETSWDRTQEEDLLEELLDPVRTSWIDQVLLEWHKRDKREVGPGVVEIDAEVELGYLVGVDTWIKARSNITYQFALATGGNYLLIRETESVHTIDTGSGIVEELTVGQHKASVLNPGG
jgi:hypothetical protein